MKNLSRKFKLLFTLTTISALFIIAVSVRQTQWNRGVLLSLFLFAILAITSESLPVALPKGGYVTVGFAIFLTALILFPQGVVVIIAAMAGLFVLGKDAKGYPLFKRAFNASQYVLSIAIAYQVLALANITSFQLTWYSVLIYLTAAIIYTFTNVTIVTFALAFLQGNSPGKIWISNIRWSTPNFIALAPLGLLMALIYTNYGFFGLSLLFIPLLLSRHSFQLYIAMRENYLNTIETLVEALEAKDKYTSGHSTRVASLAVALAEKLKMSPDKTEFIRYASVLHDVGKIGVNETILNKEERLVEWEWEIVRDHPVIGQNIIKRAKFLFDVGKVVRHHHERYDGFGYPDGLKEEEIPLGSRIIAIADTFDAMTSDRSYRKSMTRTEALDELKRVAGTQLDPQLVGIFCTMMEKETELADHAESKILA